MYKVRKEVEQAIALFNKALEADETRHDAAIELASQYSILRRNADALALLSKYENALSQSSMYLDLAGTIYTEIGLPEKAYPLYKKANSVQAGVDLFQANLASCSVFLGKIDEAREIYTQLLQRFPNHQRNHYELSRLEKAKDDKHIIQMRQIEDNSTAPPQRNIFLYYAIGKEYEDLGMWDESFRYYKKGADAVCKVANYDIHNDIDLIDTIIECCSKQYIENASTKKSSCDTGPNPIFVVGLPRTGTTLTERIISSHSMVSTIGETLSLPMALKRISGIVSPDRMNSDMIRSLVDKDPQLIADEYIDAVRYRLGDEAFFVEKLPYNHLHLGFIASAFPHAKIVCLRRNPMDTCFSMYKQVFTWAYKFSYNLDHLGQYYKAYDRLCDHWRDVLGDRLIEIDYEDLATDVDTQTHSLLNKLGLSIEDGCFNFHENAAPSTTASSVQIRQKAHAKSVNKWQYFEKHLSALTAYFEK